MVLAVFALSRNSKWILISWWDGKQELGHRERQAVSNQPCARNIWLLHHLWFLISTVQLQLNRIASICGALMLTAKLLLEYNNRNSPMDDFKEGVSRWMAKGDRGSEEAPALYMFSWRISARAKSSCYTSNTLFHFSAQCWSMDVFMRAWVMELYEPQVFRPKGNGEKEKELFLELPCEGKVEMQALVFLCLSSHTHPHSIFPSSGEKEPA